MRFREIPKRLAERRTLHHIVIPMLFDPAATPLSTGSRGAAWLTPGLDRSLILRAVFFSFQPLIRSFTLPSSSGRSLSLAVDEPLDLLADG